MRLAIAHDWLLNQRGAERVLRDFCLGLRPERLYTLLVDHDSLGPEVASQTIYRAPIGRWPGINRVYRSWVPLLPRAIERLRVSDCDLLISISHTVAKAIPRDPEIPHLCYCLTPMRHLWEPQLYDSLRGSTQGWLYHAAMRIWGPRLRRWDRQTAANVDHFVAISETVRERIERVYQRRAEVVYPGIDLQFYQPQDAPREDYYLIVSALVPQKQLELAIEAFNRNRRRLVIVGTGPWGGRLQRMAKGDITFLGWQPDAVVRDLYARARALVFPGVEDFGLVPVEAQAMGCPVVGFAEGGLTETVIEGETGVLFHQRHPDSVNRALTELEKAPLDTSRIAAQGRRFSRERCLAAWRDMLGRYSSI